MEAEYNQQLSCWPDLALLGCSFVSLHFLWGILHTSTVYALHWQENVEDRQFCTCGFITAMPVCQSASSEPHSNASLSVTLSYVTLHLHNGTHDAGINGLMRATPRHDGPYAAAITVMPACLHACISTADEIE